MPASAPVPHSESHNAKPPITPSALWGEVKRIGWDEGLKRKDKTRAWRWIERIYLVAVLGVGTLTGALTRDGNSLLDRVTSDPVFLKIALAYIGYEGVMKAVEVVQDDKQEFDEAVRWLTYPVRVGMPLSAVGFLIGDNLAGVWSHEISPWGSLAVVVVCVILLIGGLLRAAVVALRSRTQEGGPNSESAQAAVLSEPTH